MKAHFNNKKLTKNDIVTLKNVIQIVVQNYSDKAITFTTLGVSRSVPARNKILNVPSAPFTIDCLGLPFDVEFEIAFDNAALAKEVIIDYTTIKNC